MMYIVSKSTNEVYAEIITDHSMTLEEAVDLVADEYYDHDPYMWTDDPDGKINGKDFWWDDLDYVSAI